MDRACSNSALHEGTRRHHKLLSEQKPASVTERRRLVGRNEGAPCADPGATGRTSADPLHTAGSVALGERSVGLSRASGEPDRAVPPWPIDDEIAVLTGEYRPRVEQIRSYDLSGSRGERVRRIEEGESRSTAQPLGSGSDNPQRLLTTRCGSRAQLILIGVVQHMTLPTNREEVEDAYAVGNDPSFTKAEMVRQAREYFGLSSMVRRLSKSELAEFFREPDRRPTILAIMQDRHREAQKQQAIRRDAINEGLGQRPGKWRFAAMARLPRGTYEDAISGVEFSDGVLVRDRVTKEILPVANTTVTDLKRRGRMPWFDMNRLPVAEDGGAAAVPAREEEVQQILDSVPAPPASESAAIARKVEEILQSLSPKQAD